MPFKKRGNVAAMGHYPVTALQQIIGNVGLTQAKGRTWFLAEAAAQ